MSLTCSAEEVKESRIGEYQQGFIDSCITSAIVYFSQVGKKVSDAELNYISRQCYFFYDQYGEQAKDVLKIQFKTQVEQDNSYDII